jgi:hypothetical protein
MSTIIMLPIVSSCAVDACGFNHDGCRAGAINLSADAAEHAHCTTFVHTEGKAGHSEAAGVGACTRTDCVYNNDMACTAETIDIGAEFNSALCLTFSHA